jgi:hypothetical protein
MVLGEAPSRTSAAPFEGSRLGLYLGADPAGRFELANLLDAWPGPAGKGSAFPLAEARAAADLLDLGGRRVILCGWRVAAALDFRAPAYLRWRDHRGARMAVLPHPSGVNRWWNDPGNRRRARRFLRRWAGAV